MIGRMDEAGTESRSVLLVEHDALVIAGLSELLTRESLRVVIAATDRDEADGSKQ